MPKPTFSQPYYRNEIRPIFNNRVALHTRYGGLLTVREAWDWLNVNQTQRKKIARRGLWLQSSQHSGGEQMAHLTNRRWTKVQARILKRHYHPGGSRLG